MNTYDEDFQRRRAVADFLAETGSELLDQADLMMLELEMEEDAEARAEITRDHPEAVVCFHNPLNRYTRH